MGRYYSGDIEGKFWFAVQSSDAADRFGVTGNEPQELYYYFCKEEDFPKVKEEIEKIKNTLGNYKEKIDNFFETKSSYTDEELAKHLNVNIEDAKLKLKDYADLELGIKIRDCIKENGECQFTAEF